MNGTIVVVDERGAEHASESGSFSLLISGAKRAPVTVTVKDGAWTQPVPVDATFFISSIVLGGRTAIALPHSGPFMARSRELQLRCRWNAIARLHVVDEVDGAELDGLRLYCVTDFDAPGVEAMLRRPMSGLVGEDLVSPIEIRFESVQHDFDVPMYFAHRSGYAWGAIKIDVDAGGDFVLKLSRGGDLRVSFEGAVRDSRVRLRLYRKQGTDLGKPTEWGHEFWATGASPMLELEGLAVGAYVMRAEIGPVGEARILAQQELTIVAGERANVVLSVGEVPKPAKVDVEITVRLDASWKLEQYTLAVKELDAPIDGADKWMLDWNFHWMIDSEKMTAVDAQTRTRLIHTVPGRHEFRILEAGFGIDETIGPATLQHVLLDVPAPGRVVVHAIDGESGEPISGAWYRWRWKSGSDTRFHGDSRGRRETAPGQLEFLAPIGAVEVEALSIEHSRARLAFDVSPGPNEVKLALSRNYRVELVLREGDRVVPWAMQWLDGLKLEGLDGRTVAGRWSVDPVPGRMTYFVPEAGVYRISIPPLSGYRKVEPFEVTLDERKLIEKIVQIVRE